MRLIRDGRDGAKAGRRSVSSAVPTRAGCGLSAPGAPRSGLGHHRRERDRQRLPLVTTLLAGNGREWQS